MSHSALSHISNGTLDYLHVDDSIIVVNKPAKLLSVPGRGEDKQDCVWTRVQEEFSDALIVHRLDYATSGLLILARGKAAHRHLSIQFQDRVPKKQYQAIVAGTLPSTSGQVNAALRCDWENRPLQMVDPIQGKPATTQWTLLEQIEGAERSYSRVQLTPITGRSHQLRVHMLSIGHPILGDEFYAPAPWLEDAPRLLLHAQTLTLRHPETGDFINFEATCPF